MTSAPVMPRNSAPDLDPLGEPSPDGGLGTLTEERVEPAQVEPGDHERFSHYVKKDKIMESAVTGTPVIAICGKVWVPNRDPQKFPVCPDCQKIYDSMPHEPAE